MTILWIFMSIGALLVGSFVAWRVVCRCRTDHPVWVRWFLAVMIVSFGFFVFRVFQLIESPFRFGCLVSLSALYLPILSASIWAIRKAKQ